MEVRKMTMTSLSQAGVPPTMEQQLRQHPNGGMVKGAANNDAPPSNNVRGFRREEQGEEADFQPASPQRMIGKNMKAKAMPGAKNIPWDKIAVGVVMLDDDNNPGPQVSANSANSQINRGMPKRNSPQNHRPPNQFRAGMTRPAAPSNFQNRPMHNNFTNTMPHPNARPQAPQYRQYPTRQPAPAPAPKPPVMIDVGPNMKLPLRGKDETWRAIQGGRSTVTSCISCQIELNCLEDAQLVICPDCTMLSPVDQTEGEGSSGVSRYGVGVGVKPADVVAWMNRNM